MSQGVELRLHRSRLLYQDFDWLPGYSRILSY